MYVNLQHTAREAPDPTQSRITADRRRLSLDIKAVRVTDSRVTSVGERPFASLEVTRPVEP
jgi:hypothetical protein